MADTCDNCQAEPVQFIVGNAQTGDQQFLGAACFARFGLEFAKVVLPAEEIAAQLGPLFVTPGRKESIDKAAKRAKSKPAKTEPETIESTEPAPGAPEVAAAAADK